MGEPQRPRGRPKGGRTFDKVDIVNAALDELASEGYAALTMRGVARSMGASLATVQRHFATKDDLWRGAVDAAIEGATPATKPSSDPLRDGIAALLGSGIDHPGLLAAVMCDQAPGHADRFAYLSDRLRERHEAFYSAVTAGQATGSLRDIDASALLLLLNVGIGSIASAQTATRDIYGFDLEDQTERDRLTDALADILRSGI